MVLQKAAVDDSTLINYPSCLGHSPLDQLFLKMFIFFGLISALIGHFSPPLFQAQGPRTLQPDVISHCSALACRAAWPWSLGRLERLEAPQAVLNAAAGRQGKGEGFLG